MQNRNTDKPNPHATAARFILLGLALAVILHFPNLHRDLNIRVPYDGFPLNFIANGLNMMVTFFHEIGHASSGWLFGYPTIPVFDTKHGGGMAWHSDQHWFVITCVYLGFGWLMSKVWGHRGAMIAVAVLAAIHAALLVTDGHTVWILIMGHGFEIGFGVFFLIRCLYDMAPRGALERALNGIFGFYFLFSTMTVCWGIIYDPIYRQVYRAQKGTEDFGDLSRISLDHLHVSLNSVAGTLFGVAVLGMLLPFVLYAAFPPSSPSED